MKLSRNLTCLAAASLALLTLAAAQDGDEPALAAKALGRRNAKLEAALAGDVAREAVARNRVLMDLRLAAKRYDTLDGYLQRGTWDEAGFRAWVAEQRIAGLEVEPACRILAGGTELLVRQPPQLTARLNPDVQVVLLPASKQVQVSGQVEVPSAVITPNASGDQVIALSPDVRVVDRRKLAEVAGTSKLKLAPAALVLETTGYAPGGVAPVGLPPGVAIVVDERVAAQDAVYGGSGTDLHMMRIRTRDVIRLNGALVAEIVQSPEP